LVLTVRAVLKVPVLSEKRRLTGDASVSVLRVLEVRRG
jgi:hypothetical protein